MNTVKIIKLKTGYQCEFHGSGLIPIQDYSGFATGDMAKDAAEWCARNEPIMLPQPEGYTCEEALDSYPDPPERPEDDKSGSQEAPLAAESVSASNSLAAVGQTESGVALDGSGAVLPPQRQEHNEAASNQLQVEMFRNQFLDLLERLQLPSCKEKRQLCYQFGQLLHDLLVLQAEPKPEIGPNQPS